MVLGSTQHIANTRREFAWLIIGIYQILHYRSWTDIWPRGATDRTYKSGHTCGTLLVPISGQRRQL